VLSVLAACVEFAFEEYDASLASACDAGVTLGDLAAR